MKKSEKKVTKYLILKFLSISKRFKKVLFFKKIIPPILIDKKRRKNGQILIVKMDDNLVFSLFLG